MGDFRELFQEDRDRGYGDNFEVSRVTQVADDPNAAVETLAAWVAGAKADPTVTADLLAAAGWEVAVAPLQRGRVSVRRGDFGEVLAAEAIEALDGLIVPVPKLRYQIDPNQTLPGGDVTALAINDNGGIKSLHLTESKYRSSPNAGILVEAIEQLEADRRDKFATTVNFLAQRLHETNLDLYERFMTYLKSRKRRADTYGVCLTCDSTQWSESSLQNVIQLPDVLRPLLVRVITMKEPNHLIDQVCDKLELELIPHG